VENEELAAKLQKKQDKLEEYMVYQQVMDIAIESLR